VETKESWQHAYGEDSTNHSVWFSRGIMNGKKTIRFAFDDWEGGWDAFYVPEYEARRILRELLGELASGEEATERASEEPATYEYKCPKCQVVKAEQRSVERREYPAACWKCWDDYHGEPTPMRLISTLSESP
jgi:hypothetical protein